MLHLQTTTIPLLTNPPETAHESQWSLLSKHEALDSVPSTKKYTLNFPVSTPAGLVEQASTCGVFSLNTCPLGALSRAGRLVIDVGLA